MGKLLLIDRAQINGVLSGKCTQRRELVTLNLPVTSHEPPVFYPIQKGSNKIEVKHKIYNCQFGCVGDERPIGERWTWCFCNDPNCTGVAYFADNYDPAVVGTWKKPAEMPMWATRAIATITGLRAYRLQRISVEGAMAEGVYRQDGLWYGLNEGCLPSKDPIVAYASWWDWRRTKRNKLVRSTLWAANPLVWEISFVIKRVVPGRGLDELAAKLEMYTRS